VKKDVCWRCGKQMITFNINDMVKVKLTEYGKKVLFEDYRKHYNMEPIYKENKDGTSEWQLWNLMHLFGPYMYNGGKNVIEENNISFCIREKI